MNGSQENRTVEYSGHDPLFVNAVLGWLEDMEFVTPDFSLEQLDAILDVQREFSPKGDRFLAETKRVRNTMQRCVAEGKLPRRLMRERTKRAAKRAGLPSDWFSAGGDKYQNIPSSAKDAAQELGQREHRRAVKGDGSLVDRTKDTSKRPRFKVGDDNNDQETRNEIRSRQPEFARR